jgi:DNA-directed RNA polymerase subunit RPC12/RpoP
MSTQVSLKTLTCRTCGADLIFDPATQATVCNYCGNSFRVEEAVDKVVPTPDGILPFKVAKDQYHQRLLEWLIEGDYTPDDILESSVFDQVNGIYLPLFMYVGKYHAPWVAAAGFDRKESSLITVNGKLVNTTKTVTDWRPCNGEANGSFTELIFAGEHVKPEIAQFAAGCGFGTGDLKEYDPRYTLGFVMQGFAGSDEEVWSTQISGRVKALVEADIKQKIPGDRQRDLSYDLSTEKKAFRVYAPYWIVYYKYKGAEYHVCMDGLTSARMDGKRPEDQDRKKTVSKFFLPAHICLAIWLVVFFGAVQASQDAGTAAFFIGLIPTIILYVRASSKKKVVIEKSKAIRQQILGGFKAGKKALRNQPAKKEVPPPVPKQPEPSTAPAPVAMEDLKFQCPHCGQSLEAERGMAGTVLDCPSCQGHLQVPTL